jgi:outer membrane protein OmpA-like peptidoglycan-associated protein
VRLAIILSVLIASPALAQVSVNGSALDALKPSAPAAAPATSAPATSRQHPVAKPATRQSTHTAPAHPARATSAHSTPAQAPAAKPGAARLPPRVGPPRPVTLAPAAPAPVVLPPLVELPTHPAPPPPAPVPTVADAIGEVIKLPGGGVRITFGPGKSDLNPATMNAIRDLAHAIKDNPNTDVNLFAYAAGVPDDPSTPRRLSLSRALAVRAVLISEGIVSTRIYPRALGAPPDGVPDRVDMTSGATTGAPPGQ